MATTYRILAQDAENDVLRYELFDGPTDIVVDAVNGQVTWTPDDSQEGIFLSDSVNGFWRFSEESSSHVAENASGNGLDWAGSRNRKQYNHT